MKPTTPDTAIVLSTRGGQSSVADAIHREIAKILGGNDYDYFTHSEAVVEATHKTEQVKHKFRVVLVEDAEGAKHQLWFDITQCA